MKHTAKSALKFLEKLRASAESSGAMVKRLDWSEDSFDGGGPSMTISTGGGRTKRDAPKAPRTSVAGYRKRK